jgi:MOSC domain-containing protein YiiM
VTRCPSCRWSPTDVTRNDLGGSLRSVGARWRWATEGLDNAALVAERSSDGTTLAHLAKRLVQSLGGRFDDPAPDRTAIQAAIDSAALGAAAEVQTADDVAGLHDRAHDASHVLRDAGRLVHELGWGAPTSTGVVTGIQTSRGGVPKLPVDRDTISLRGLAGDRQTERRHHGRLWQAVSLWSAEVIDDLRREGHDVAPGAAGENLTLAGLDWSTVRPGARLRAGPDVVLEFTSWASPCSKIAQCFTGRDFSRIDHDRRPGWSRAYAAVLVDGEVRQGDEALLEPDDQRSDAPAAANGRRAG